MIHISELLLSPLILLFIPHFKSLLVQLPVHLARALLTSGDTLLLPLLRGRFLHCSPERANFLKFALESWLQCHFLPRHPHAHIIFFKTYVKGSELTHLWNTCGFDSLTCALGDSQRPLNTLGDALCAHTQIKHPSTVPAELTHF